MRKRLIATVLALTLAIPFGITGCGTGKQKTVDKEEITMYLWDKSMSKQPTPWLEAFTAVTLRTIVNPMGQSAGFQCARKWTDTWLT